jgi:PAS domain S-box-containing protein
MGILLPSKVPRTGDPQAIECDHEIIRVIHIDDDESQKTFVKTFVEGDPSIKITSVSDPETAIELVQTGRYDCLVSDYDMPVIDGISLSLKMREHSRIPIIIYTGKGSEEIAERAFAAGIDDYIRKEMEPAHYQVLAKRIRHVVEERRAEESYRSLFENASDAIYIHSLDGRLLDLNEVACKRIGCSREDLMDVNVDDKASPFSGTSFKEKIDRIVREGQCVFESKNRARDGRVIPVEVSAKAIKYKGMDAILSFSRDITERVMMKAEMSSKLEAIRRHANKIAMLTTIGEVANYSIDVVQNVIGFTEAAFGLVEGDELRFVTKRGEPNEVLKGMSLKGKGLSVKAFKTGVTQLVNDTSSSEDFVDYVRTHEIRSELDVPVRIDDEVVAVINVEKDEPNAFSRSDAELIEILSEHVASSIIRIKQIGVIREAEETYRKLLDSSLELVALVSGTKLTYLNSVAAKKLGYDSPDDLIGEDISKVLTKETLTEVRERALSRQRGEPQPNRYELTLLNKNGNAMAVEASFSLITRNGKPSILIIGRDVSEIKRQARQVNALHRHATMLAEARTKDEVIRATLDAVESVVGFHFLSILEPVDNALEIVQCRGLPISVRRYPLDGRGLTVKAAKEKRSILTPNVAFEPSYLRGAADSRSELDVPVLVNGETAAVINLESAELSAFDELDRELMETLALHVASALQRINF